MIFSYCRVSTVEQAADDATSLGEQQRKNRAAATIRGAKGFDFANYSDAGVSGSIPLAKRPAGRELLAALKKGDIIIVSKLDRMFRNSLDALWMIKEFKEMGVSLILLDISLDPIDQSAVGELFFTMLAAFASFERRQIAERMDTGRKAKKRAGGHVGGSAPYGFRIVGSMRSSRLEEVPEEQKVIARAVELYSLPQNGVAAVCRIMTEEGYRSRTGKPFQITQITRMLDGDEADAAGERTRRNVQGDLPALS